jgi:REP element-mobilizing transposase RayT
MPRRPRVFIEGGIYHVYNRFARGDEVFLGAAEAELFVDLLRRARERDGLTVFAWCLMSNHYHLAVRSGPVPLSRTLGFVQGRFSQGFNLRHRSTGPMWQSRYKAKLVEDQGYLEQLVAYIHLNPVSAGLVDDPSEYPLSGHRELLVRMPGALIDADQTLSIFGGTLRDARRRYVRQLGATREVQWRTELPGRLPWWQREPDRPVEPESAGAWIDERGVSTGLERPRVSAERFLVLAAELLHFALDELRGPGSGRRVTSIRSLVLALAVERWQLRPCDFAPLFHRRNDVVSRWVRWGVDRRTGDPAFRELYQTLDQNLSQRLVDSPPVAGIFEPEDAKTATSGSRSR